MATRSLVKKIKKRGNKAELCAGFLIADCQVFGGNSTQYPANVLGLQGFTRKFQNMKIQEPEKHKTENKNKKKEKERKQTKITGLDFSSSRYHVTPRQAH